MPVQGVVPDSRRCDVIPFLIPPERARQQTLTSVGSGSGDQNTPVVCDQLATRSSRPYRIAARQNRKRDMTKAMWLAGAALCLLCGPVVAQTAAPDRDVQTGVLVFDPAFFADSRPDTALDMIARLPGFNFDGGNSETRGLAGTAGNVLIDGARPSTKSDGLGDILGRISAAGVARIELISGGSPGIDMQGQAVVANVILLRTVTTERVFEAEADILADGHFSPGLTARYARREGDNQIEGSISGYWDRSWGDSEGFRRRFTPAGDLIQDASLASTARNRGVRATAAGQRRIAGGLFRASGLLDWSADTGSQDQVIRSGGGTSSFNTDEEDQFEGEFGLDWNREFGARSGLELTGLQRFASSNSFAGSNNSSGNSNFTSETTTGESIGRAILRFRPSDRWALETGGEVAYNFLDSATAYSEDGIPVPLPSSSVKVEELRGEVFGQATWRPDPTLTLEGGLRVEVSEITQSGDSDLTKSFVFPKVRLQTTWTPRAGHQLRLRLEREVGQLDFGDFTASADINLGQVEGGNPDLEPQKSSVLEAAYEYRFWGEGALLASWSYAAIEDVVDIIPLAGGFDGVGNIGDGIQETFELRLTLPTDRLGISNGRLQLSGNWTSSEVTDPVTGQERAFQNDLDFGCDASFEQDLGDGRWTWGVEHDCNTYRGRVFRVREIRRAYLEPEVSAYLQWKPVGDLTVRVDVENLTDRVRGNDRDLYAGPRNTAPLSLRETRRVTSGPSVEVQVRRAF